MKHGQTTVLQHMPFLLLPICCHTAQAEVRAVYPHVEGILPYLLYSDGACVRLGGHIFHVLNIMSAAGTIGEARGRQGYARIALLPKVSRKHLGLPKKLSSAEQETCVSCSACMAFSVFSWQHALRM